MKDLLGEECLVVDCTGVCIKTLVAAVTATWLSF